jgi:hypothetical protein
MAARRLLVEVRRFFTVGLGVSEPQAGCSRFGH